MSRNIIAQGRAEDLLLFFSEDGLLSDRGVDYGKLQDLLKAGKKITTFNL